MPAPPVTIAFPETANRAAARRAGANVAGISGGGADLEVVLLPSPSCMKGIARAARALRASNETMFASVV